MPSTTRFYRFSGIFIQCCPAAGLVFGVVTVFEGHSALHLLIVRWEGFKGKRTKDRYGMLRQCTYIISRLGCML